MASFRDVTTCWIVAAALGCVAPQAQQVPSANPLDRAQDAVVAYINKLAEVHCTEDVEQVKVQPNGRTEASAKSQYDYFVLLQGSSIDLQLAESRLAVAKAPQRQKPLLLSNGFSMLLLIFHPYYRSAFSFTFEGQEQSAGRPAMRYHFAHIEGARSPAALALRGREYPLDLQGSARIDAETGQPLRIDAELLHPMTDIGLESLAVHVLYAPVKELAGTPVLASVVNVDLETPRQHWRNSHVFRNYKLFSADATQDPNVKVHVSAADTQSGSSPSSNQPQEKR